MRIAFGIMGGWNQAQAHAQFVSHIVDYGMNIQAAMEAARFTKATFAGLRRGYRGSRFRPSVLDALKRARPSSSDVHSGYLEHASAAARP